MNHSFKKFEEGLSKRYRAELAGVTFRNKKNKKIPPSVGKFVTEKIFVEDRKKII